MLRRLYDRLLAECDKPGAIWLLAGVAFAESSFFPIPPDVMLIPMMLANRRRVWLLATVATISSVIGGFLGYAIGYWLFETVGRFLIEHLMTMQGFERAKAQFDIWGFWLIIGKGVTPIPYKIVTILCGVLHYDLAKFALASIIARGLRFYLEGVFLYFFGEPARAFVEKRLAMTMTAVAVLLIGGFVVALRYH